ncbi:Hypothetical protein FKW44_016283 [Caligus rogercresseyi]|uniref:Uncharacterized protein n=1 Tax=Caligus rogercresseyi TaxID=217165 RepID=A0A7T8H1N8_CALRO|nr:Hypothetical protein FKW44_016283 [Caligus rogercresseyi]
MIAFHVIFGKTVPDVSLNAVANLGYAQGRWLLPVWPGDTLRSRSEDDRAQAKFKRQNRRGLCAPPLA